MRTSENINEIASAISSAQAQIIPAAYDAANPHFRSRYASLASCMQSCRAALSQNKIAVVQGTTCSDKYVTVTTMLIHSSGQFISDDITIPIAQNTAQAIGSALTYGRRYGLSALVGIVSDEDDDDAELAMPHQATENNMAGDVKFTPQKETVKSQQPQPKPPTPAVSESHTSNTQEVKANRESKVKRATIRASKIKEIFEKSTELGMNLSQLKAFISEITGKSIAESEDLSDTDLPFILGELQKLQHIESKVA